ncbi:MAG: hypothetical protein U0Q18_29585 [Bryobacteraceae bacterium]
MDKMTRAFALVAVLWLPIAWGADQKEACVLLAKTDAEAALGEAVGDPRGQIVSKGGAKTPAVSTCQFDSAAKGSLKSVSLMVRYSRQTGSRAVAETRKTLSKGTLGVKDLPGLGDHALWAFMKSGKTTSGQLNVFKGGAQLAIGINGMAGEGPALEKARSLAQKILPRI